MTEIDSLSLASRLRDLLPDDFSRSLLDASLRAFADPISPLRLTFFSLGMREMVGHMLHRMAPDKSVEACSWFTKEHETITRRQRAKYMVQGGLADDFLQSINVDMATLYASVRPKLDELSKHVHVREATTTADYEMDSVVVDTLSFLTELLEAIRTCRTQVNGALENEIQEETVMTLVTESLDEVDVASSSHSVDTVDVLSTTIVSIDEETLQFHIKGEVGIDFHWGSSDDGIDGNETFPFELKMWSFVDDMQKFNDIELMVDADFWHEQFGPDIDC
jgi:hypothetical protein